MKKKTKLKEKASRVPDIREKSIQEKLATYLHDVEPLNNEAARSLRFGMFLSDLLGVEPKFIESYVSGVEKYLKTKGKDRILIGRADNLFGNVIIEFEFNIPKHRKEAEEQLQRYTAILWSQEKLSARTPYLCIATDGVRFVSYSPTLQEPAKKDVSPEDVSLNILEEADWTKLKSHEVYFWLDRYFLRKEILPPTTEAIVRDFGRKSHAFQTLNHALLVQWTQIKEKSTYAVIYESWEKYLRIVYGSDIGADELFVRHTYLATLAKLMAWMRITGSATLPDDEQIIEILEGHFFKSQGIENFIEEDFFSWLARGVTVKTAISVSRLLFSLLQKYNLRELSEDVMKSLYQELVDPETRHDLGEFYTPDWLAHRMVNRVLDENPKSSVLDPACGSGTFLYLTIKEKKERLSETIETLNHILNSVCGADIHPLAVIIAKTNYILALGELIKKRKGNITIPVYLADTMKLPPQWSSAHEISDYVIEVNGVEMFLTPLLIQDSALYDQAIELSKEFATQNKGKTVTQEQFEKFLTVQHFKECDNSPIVRSLYSIAHALKRFIETERDTIWAYILKNNYKPLFFKHRFDVVIGNPPWIAFRFMEPGYQKFLKEQVIKNYNLLSKRGELITHLEIATLFLVRAADLYLKSGGMISFVLPRSLFTADQHDGLRKREFKFNASILQTLSFTELWDCEQVAPLFKVPSCVLMAKKVGKDSKEAKNENIIPGEILKGKLQSKNASLLQADKQIVYEKDKFTLSVHGKHSYWSTGKTQVFTGESPYKKHFSQGATIVPRSFWFVQIKPSSVGINVDTPPIETDDRAREQAKDAYKTVFLKGTVENQFLYATLLSTDLLPFGYLGYRLVVLPIKSDGEHYKMMDAKEAHSRGYVHLAQWLEKVEKEWVKRRGEKAEKMTIYERLNRVRGLTQQNPQRKFCVLYNTSGTFLTSAVVENENVEFSCNGQKIVAQGFLADTKTYFCELENKGEAFFLAAVLNAPEIDKLIKPMQSRGLMGPRDIHKKVLELPIPQFDTNNSAHRELSELGKSCAQKVSRWLSARNAGNIKSIGRLRGMVRGMLKDDLNEIDGIVKGILG